MLREVSQQGETSQTESETDTDGQRTFVQLVEKLQQIAAMGAMQDTPRPSYSGSKSQQGHGCQ